MMSRHNALRSSIQQDVDKVKDVHINSHKELLNKLHNAMDKLHATLDEERSIRHATEEGLSKFLDQTITTFASDKWQSMIIILVSFDHQS